MASEHEARGRERAISAIRPDRASRQFRRLRALAIAGLAIIVPMFVIGGFLRVQWLLPRQCFVRVEGGTLDVGYEADPRADPLWSVVVERSYYPSLGASAWRPFRVSGVYGSALVIPLWQPFVLLVALAAYSHGFLRGRRKTDPSRCANCGYSLRGLPAADGIRTCPECGRAQFDATL